MSTLQSIYDAIVQSPEDLQLRLVYADALDEAGDSARAEYIRVQCELTSMGELSTSRGEWVVKEFGGMTLEWSGPSSRDWAKYRDLMQRQEAALRQFGHEWSRPVATACGLGSTDWGYSGGGDPGTLGGGVGWLFNNGFVEEISCFFDFWVGGECRYCNGHGGRYVPVDPEDYTKYGNSRLLGEHWHNCYYCSKGHFTAKGPNIVKSCPIRRIDGLGKTPTSRYGANRDAVYWLRDMSDIPGLRNQRRVELYEDGYETHHLGEHSILGSVFDLLDGVEAGLCTVTGKCLVKAYLDDDKAHRELERALIKWAKQQ